MVLYTAHKNFGSTGQCKIRSKQVIRKPIFLEPSFLDVEIFHDLKLNDPLKSNS